MRNFKIFLISVIIFSALFLIGYNESFAGFSCSATGSTSASFSLTGCPNPGHGALRFLYPSSPYWSATISSGYAFCNSPASVGGLSSGTSYNFGAYDSNNSAYGGCTVTTSGGGGGGGGSPATGTIRISTNLSSATWFLSGPGTNQTGTGSVVLTGKSPGTYNLWWNSMGGYTAPVSPVGGTLLAGSSITLSGNYTIITTTVTISKIGTGSGTITSSPVGINCGATCSRTFSGISTLTLTASPGVGSTFNGWFSNSAGTNYFYPPDPRAPGSTNCNTGTICSFGAGANFTIYPKFTGPATGTVSISPNISSASWSLSGPSTATGTGSSTLTGRTPGNYTITWNDVVGYNKTTITQSLTLSSGGTITFSNTYTAITPPVISSPTATSVSTTSATLGANITSDGGAVITARGTCWGTTINPTTNCTAQGGTAIGVFTQPRTGLPSSTLIYYRGYATNSAGTGYSSTASFTTAAETLSVVLTVAPTSGIAPQNISLSATVSGTATGTINYTFYCNRNNLGTNITLPYDAKFDGVSNTTQTTDCNYSSAGTFYPKVIIERGGAPAATDRKTVTITAPANSNPQISGTSITSNISANCGGVGSRVALIPTLRWTYSDADGDAQASYRVIIRQGGVTVRDSGQVTSASNYYDIPTSSLSYNTSYTWTIQVWDVNGGTSGVVSGTGFTTIRNALPSVAFGYFPSPIYQDVETQFCSANEGNCVGFSFTPTSCAGTCNNWQWTIPAGASFVSPSAGSTKNPVLKFIKGNGQNTSLRVTDNSGYYCTTTSAMDIGLPLPQYKER